MRGVVEAPPSKSYTHRALICAALAEGESKIIRPLDADDTRATAEGLIALGADIKFSDGVWIVNGTGGKLTPRNRVIDCRQSGTTMRLLTAVGALSSEPILLTGAPRLLERPMGELIKALGELGAKARSLNEKDANCPPVEVWGGLKGGEVSVRGDISSQFISALLLVAPFAMEEQVVVQFKGDIVSYPYIEITQDVMRSFGVSSSPLRSCSGFYPKLSVSINPSYHARRYKVEGDYSQAAYFGLAAALTDIDIRITKLRRLSHQGDKLFFHLLEGMGCEVFWGKHWGLRVKGVKEGALNGLRRPYGDSLNLSCCPDIVPPFAVAAAFAEGETLITGIHHLESKESARVTVLFEALQAMGVDTKLIVSEGRVEGLRIVGGKPKPALIETHHDHRMAMSFGCAKLVLPELELDDYACVRKSYPNFWRDLNTATGGKHEWLGKLAELTHLHSRSHSR